MEQGESTGLCIDHSTCKVCGYHTLPWRWDDVVQNNAGVSRCSRLGDAGIWRGHFRVGRLRRWNIWPRMVEVLTIAHAQAPYVLVGQAGDDDTGEQQHASQPVQEAPAELPDAEPLDEERIVPFTDENTVTVDGTVLSYDHSLKALRAGCQALGLSKRGSKKDCMRRMLEFVKTREQFLRRYLLNPRGPWNRPTTWCMSLMKHAVLCVLLTVQSKMATEDRLMKPLTTASCHLIFLTAVECVMSQTSWQCWLWLTVTLECALPCQHSRRVAETLPTLWLRCAVSLFIVVMQKQVCAVIQNHQRLLCLKQFHKFVQLWGSQPMLNLPQQEATEQTVLLKRW